jgi:hypothetical protein
MMRTIFGVFFILSFFSSNATDLEECYSNATRQKRHRNISNACLGKLENDEKSLTLTIKQDKIIAGKSSLLVTNKKTKSKKLIAGEDTGLTNIKMIAKSTVPNHVIVVNQNDDFSTSILAINYTRNGNIRPRLIYHSDSPPEDFKNMKLRGSKVSFKLNGQNYQLEQSSHSKK